MISRASIPALPALAFLALASPQKVISTPVGPVAGVGPASTVPAPNSEVLVRVEIPPLSEQTYVKLADAIVRGRVLFQMPVDPGGDELAYTAIDLEVASVLKGNPPERLTLHVTGAKTERVHVRVPAAPVFETGEEVLLFLTADRDRHGWEYYGVLGLRRGTYRLVQLPGGELGVQSAGRSPVALAEFERMVARTLADGQGGGR